MAEKKVDVKKVAEEAKKATEVVKETVEKVAEKKPAVKKTVAKKPAAKKTTKKVAATKSVVLQFSGDEFKIDEIVEKAEQAFKAENKRKAIHDIKVYVKPEERAAYYVVTSGDSEYAGRVDL